MTSIKLAREPSSGTLVGVLPPRAGRVIALAGFAALALFVAFLAVPALLSSGRHSAMILFDASGPPATPLRPGGLLGSAVLLPLGVATILAIPLGRFLIARLMRHRAKPIAS